MNEKWAEIAIFIVALICMGIVVYEISQILSIAV